MYARLSARSDDADNIPQQVARGIEQAERWGWTVVAAGEDARAFIDDGISAYKKDAVRPSWNDLVVRCLAGDIDVIIARDSDRLSRNWDDYAKLVRSGAKVSFLAEGNGEPLDPDDTEGAIRAMMSRSYSKKISQNQRLAEDRRIARGQAPRGGNRHFGYHSGRCCPADGCRELDVSRHGVRREKREGEWVVVGDCGCDGSCIPHTVHDDEAATVHELAGRWLAGERMRALARDLNERGITTTRGNPWTHINLKKMLLSPRLAGIRVHERDGEVREHRGAWEPVIGRDLHARLINADGGSTGRRAPERYPLTGLLVCGLCEEHPDVEGTVTLNGHMHRPGKRRYSCLTCRRNGIGADPVEDALWNAALGRSWHAEELDIEQTRERLGEVESKLAADMAMRAELDDAWADGEISRERWARQVDRIEKRTGALEAEARQLRREARRASNSWESLIALTDMHRDADAATRRRIFEDVFRRIVLAPNVGRRGGRVDLGRLHIEWVDGTVSDGVPPDPAVWDPA